MKKKISFKLLCLVFSAIIFACAFAVQTSAADQALTQTAAVIASTTAKDNYTSTIPDGYDHGEVPAVSACQNADGGYALCVNEGETLKILEISAQGTLTKEISVTKELTYYAAFTKGVDGKYYILFNQKLSSDEQSKTALRLVEYSADGQRLRAADIAGNVTDAYLGIAEINCGNHALAANSKYVTGYIARDMFETGGEIHQSSYAFAVEISSFKRVEKSHITYIPYASHSFHQFILKDGNDFVYVDRADAYPIRGFVVNKMSGSGSWDKDEATIHWSSTPIEAYKRGNSFIFKGDAGNLSADNDTYSQLGGIIKIGGKYMLAGTYQNTTSALTPSSANLFVQLFNSSGLDANKEIYLTDYSETADSLTQLTATVTNPKIVKISESKAAVLYMLSNYSARTEEMHIAFVDASGNLTDDVTVEMAASGTNLTRFGDAFYSSETASVEWFAVENGKIILNSIAVGTSEQESSTSASGSDSTEPSTESSDSPTGTTTTEPSTEPVQPASPSFFQRIIDFFVGIYNWFVSLFS